MGDVGGPVCDEAITVLQSVSKDLCCGVMCWKAVMLINATRVSIQPRCTYVSIRGLLLYKRRGQREAVCVS